MTHWVMFYLSSTCSAETSLGLNESAYVGAQNLQNVF